MNMQRELRLIVLLVCLARGWSSMAAPRIIFLGDPVQKTAPVDAHVVQRLQSMGFAVTFTPAAAGRLDSSAADLIIISGTVAPHQIEARLRDLPIPILTWNPDVLSDLGMTGGVRNIDYGTDNNGPHLFLYVLNAPHPMSGGGPNGLLIFYNDSQYRLSWGKPGLGATVISTLPGQLEKATLFGYERGALMHDVFSAPARRVMLFLTDAAFDQLNENGLRAFDAAVIWAAGLEHH